MGYYIQQCEKMDDLISYCGVSIEKVPLLGPLLSYESGRLTQQGCLNHDKVISDRVVCEEHLSSLGSVAEGYKRIVDTRPHIQIKNTLLYSDIYSSIAGEVVNNFSYPIESPQILATVFDRMGNAVETKHGYPNDEYLKPGQSSGFWLNLDNPVSQGGKYTITSIFDKSEKIKPEILKLNVTGTSMTPVQLSGSVTNLGNQSVKDVQLSGTFYDRNHTVVDVATSSISELFPEETLPFTLSPTNNIPPGNEISSYRVTAQSPGFFMIPP
jgi:hypothetical protein